MPWAGVARVLASVASVRAAPEGGMPAYARRRAEGRQPVHWVWTARAGSCGPGAHPCLAGPSPDGMRAPCLLSFAQVCQYSQRV